MKAEQREGTWKNAPPLPEPILSAAYRTGTQPFPSLLGNIEGVASKESIFRIVWHCYGVGSLRNGTDKGRVRYAAVGVRDRVRCQLVQLSLTKLFYKTLHFKPISDILLTKI